MTDERRAQFAAVAINRFDRHEAALTPAIEAALGEYLDKAQQLVAHAVSAIPAPRPELALVAAAPMPAGGESVSGSDVAGLVQWFTADRASALTDVLSRLAGSDTFARLLDKHVMPTYNRMLDEVLGAAASNDRVASTLNTWRTSWLEQRTQMLVKVPDVVTGVFRTAMHGLADRNGTSVDDVEKLAQTMLDRGYPSWAGRARMIARTETVGANNQGSLAAWSSLAHTAGPAGETATKTWLATEDSHTRKSHRHLDGTTVPINDMFEVHGHKMNGPGDSSGPAEEVINCRCTLTYALGGEVPLGKQSTVTRADIKAATNEAADAADALSEASADAKKAERAKAEALADKAQCATCEIRASLTAGAMSNADLFKAISAKLGSDASCCKIASGVEAAAKDQATEAAHTLSEATKDAAAATTKAKDYKLVVIDNKFVKVPLDHPVEPVSASVGKVAEAVAAAPPADKSYMLDALKMLGKQPGTSASTQATIEAAVTEEAERGAGIISRSMYDKLKPVGTHWSWKVREPLEAELKKTPEGKRFLEGLDTFQDGRGVNGLRKAINERAAGRSAASDAMGQRADAWIDAIRNAPSDITPAKLYRGMSVSGSPESVAARYAKGSDLDLGMSSFTSDPKIAAKFQSNSYTKARPTPVRIELIGDGKHAVPIQNLTGEDRSGFWSEKEWVSMGRYQIVDSKVSGGGVVVRIKQIGTL